MKKTKKGPEPASGAQPMQTTKTFLNSILILVLTLP
jgi:hypothetical protein